MASNPDAINAKIAKLISESWESITADLEASQRKSTAFNVVVNVNKEADGSLSFVVKNNFRKQTIVSQPVSTKSAGKLA
ncbi:hypothetical protein UFOVP201_38 [uncultured Caudovirales phage]|uniref:PXA domain-containing protein n=1 Tax=uncultured Caudovirales phage TaxID=2100421 RepID=A0A6J7WJI3_9CAUD|nr:hypothetical protein UFOVP201_38 [uncultured Caudovirales phage]